MSFARAVLTGTAAITLAGVVTRLISLVSMPILTRLLGPEAYGGAALAGTVTALASTLALLGIDLAYARFYFERQGAGQAEVEAFCWRYALISSAAVATAAGVLWWGVLSAFVNAAPALGVLIALATLLGPTNVMAQTRVRLAGKYGKLALAIAAAGVLSAALSILIASTWRADAVALLLAPIVATAAVLPFLGLPPLRQLGRRSSLTGDEQWNTIKLGLSCAVTAPVYWLISSSDRWFLGYFADLEVVGIYSVCFNVATVGLMLNGAVMLTFFPEVARIYGDDPIAGSAAAARLWKRLAVLQVVVWLAVVAAGGDILRLLAHERFHAGAEVIPWLAGGVFFYGLSALATTGVFLAKKMKWTAFWWALGGVLNVGLNLLLIPLLAGIGAAVSQCATYAAIFLGVLWASQRCLYLQIRFGRLVAFGCVAIAFGIVMAQPWHPSPLLSLAFKLPVGGLFALASLRLFAYDWLQRGLRTAASIVFSGRT